MSLNNLVMPLLGGGLIGLSVTIMLLFNGRVTGISGILASSLNRHSVESLWRPIFLIGLFSGGLLMNALKPELFANASGRSGGLIVLAGFLVGFGTAMGNGCTSGHGICGLSRLSVRSILATITFMLFGFLTVFFLRILGGA